MRKTVTKSPRPTRLGQAYSVTTALEFLMKIIERTHFHIARIEPITGSDRIHRRN
jgi:hypothetical protein